MPFWRHISSSRKPSRPELRSYEVQLFITSFLAEDSCPLSLSAVCRSTRPNTVWFPPPHHHAVLNDIEVCVRAVDFELTSSGFGKCFLTSSDEAYFNTV